MLGSWLASQCYAIHLVTKKVATPYNVVYICTEICLLDKNTARFISLISVFCQF